MNGVTTGTTAKLGARARDFWGRLRRFDKDAVASLARALFVLAMLVYLVNLIIGYATFEDGSLCKRLSKFLSKKVDNYLVPLLVVVLCCESFAYGITKRRLVFAAIGVILVQNVMSRYVDRGLIYMYWFAVAYPRGTDLRKLVRMTWVTATLGMLVVIGLSRVGQTADVITFEHDVVRHSLGCFNPNMLSLAVGSIVMVLLCDVMHDWRWGYAPLTLAVLVATYVVARGRVALLCGLLQLAVVCLFKASEQTGVALRLRDLAERFTYFVATWVVPAFTALTIAVTVFLSRIENSNEALYKRIDALLVGRPSHWVFYLKKLGFRLSGANIYAYSPNTGSTFLDNTFLEVLFKDGLIVLVGFLAVYVLLGRYLRRNRMLPMAISLVVFAIHGMSETITYSTVTNVSMLAIMSMASGWSLMGETSEAAAGGTASSASREDAPGVATALRRAPWGALGLAASTAALALACAFATTGGFGLLGVRPKATLESYQWGELKAIAMQISQAATDEEGVAIAARYHLCNEDGTLDPANTKELTIDANSSYDSTSVGFGLAGVDTASLVPTLLRGNLDAQVRIIGIRQDTASDGSGLAGLTFSFCDPVGTSAPNAQAATNDGGWGQSELRTTLNGSFYSLMSYEARRYIALVDKSSSSASDGTASAQVATVRDYVWIPSATELLGSSATGADVSLATGDAQYQLYAEQGVSYAGSVWTRNASAADDAAFVCLDPTQGLVPQRSSKLEGVVPAFCF